MIIKIHKVHTKSSFHTYRQGKYERSEPFCRYFQALTIVSNHFWIFIDEKAIDNFKNSLNPRKFWHWWNKKEWLETVIAWFNNYYKKQLKLWKLVTFSKRRRNKIDQWYWVSMSISVKEDFLKDYRDWKIEWKNFKWKWWPHEISMHKIDWEYCFTNTWSKNNIVSVPKENITELWIWRSWESFYVYE